VNSVLKFLFISQTFHYRTFIQILYLPTYCEIILFRWHEILGKYYSVDFVFNLDLYMYQVLRFYFRSHLNSCLADPRHSLKLYTVS